LIWSGTCDDCIDPQLATIRTRQIGTGNMASAADSIFFICVALPPASLASRPVWHAILAGGIDMDQWLGPAVTLKRDLATSDTPSAPVAGSEICNGMIVPGPPGW
jgi:hypothetical protein